MAREKVRVRVAPGTWGVDQVQANKTTLITKAWTEVSQTLAKSLVGSEFKGRPLYEFEDGPPDNGDNESETEEAEQEDNS